MSNDTLLHEKLYRGKNFKNVLSTKICVFGLGALGSNLVDTLTRQGYNKISIVDFDRIQKHNINTQIWSLEDVGKLKSNAIDYIVYGNTDIELTCFNKKVDSKNISKFAKDSTICIDCFDNTQSRKVVSEFCRKQNKDCLHLGLFEGYGEVVWNEKYSVPELDDEKYDLCDYPLSRNIVGFTVYTAAEILTQFLMSKRKKNKSITLTDLNISEYT